MTSRKSNNWRVAIACSLIIGLIKGYSRVSGLLYTATIERFNVSKSEASIPFFWFYAMTFLGGPLVGVLAEKYGSREVTTAGFVLSAMGIGMCFFAENVTVLTFFWGGVFGLGTAISGSMIGDILNDHFDRNHIGTASGISYGGAGVGSFINVFLCDCLLHQYGLSGTFLILSAIFLNGVPTGIALIYINARESLSNSKQFSKVLNNRAYNINDTESCHLSTSQDEPISQSAPEKPKERSITDYEQNIEDIESSVLSFAHNEEPSGSNGGLSNRNNDNVVNLRESLSNNVSKNGCGYNIQKAEFGLLSSTQDDPILQTKTEKPRARFITDYGQNIDKHKSSVLLFAHNEEPSGSSRRISSTSYNNVVKLEDLPPNDVLNKEALKQMPIDQTLLNNGKSVKQEDCNPSVFEEHKTDFKRSSKLTNAKVLQNIIPYLRIFWNSTFSVLCITQSSMMVLGNILMTIIIDTLKDKEIEPGLEIYPLYCFQIADTIGRFGLGWVTDCNLLSNVNFSAICFAGLGISCGALALSSSFIEFIAAVSLFGMLSGANVAVFTGTTCEFIEKDQLKMAMSTRFVLSVPMFLTAGPLIRLFRENMGSYDGIYYVLAILSFICSVLTLLIPPIARCRMKNRKMSTLNLF